MGPIAEWVTRTRRRKDVAPSDQPVWLTDDFYVRGIQACLAALTNLPLRPRSWSRSVVQLKYDRATPSSSARGIGGR